MTEFRVRSSARAGALTRWSPWVVALLLAGCSEETGVDQLDFHPVKGQVLLPDGKPLTEGSVEFIGMNGSLVSAEGKIGADGSFQLGSPETRVGAPAGEYRVRIIPGPSSYTKTARGEALNRGKLPFSPRYLDESMSNLTAVVKEGETTLEPFHLTKAGAGDGVKDNRQVRH